MKAKVSLLAGTALVLCWIALGGMDEMLLDRTTRSYFGFAVVSGLLWAGSFAAVYLRTEPPARYRLLLLVPLAFAISAPLFFVAQLLWAAWFIWPKTGYP